MHRPPALQVKVKVKVNHKLLQRHKKIWLWWLWSWMQCKISFGWQHLSSPILLLIDESTRFCRGICHHSPKEVRLLITLNSTLLICPVNKANLHCRVFRTCHLLSFRLICIRSINNVLLSLLHYISTSMTFQVDLWTSNICLGAKQPRYIHTFEISLQWSQVRMLSTILSLTAAAATTATVTTTVMSSTTTNWRWQRRFILFLFN